MKRYLKKDNFQLSDHEKENLWLSIKDGNGSSEKVDRPRRFVRPVLGLTTVMAAVLALVIFMGDDEPIGDMPGVEMKMAKRSVVAPAPIMNMNKPAGTESAKDLGTWDISSEVKPVIAKVDTIPKEKPDVVKPVTITGRIFEKKTGDPLAFANVLIVGTNRGFSTDDKGNFQLTNITPGEDLKLRVKYMGYEDEVATITPETGKNPKVEIGLEPMVVATLEAFDVESVELMVDVKDALSKKAGVASRNEWSTQMLHTRVAPVPVEPTRYGGSVTGGTTPPNGEPHELMYFDHTGVNPFVATEDDALSTFAVDVDNASYTMARKYINDGYLPPPEAIRVEEFLNFFKAGYKQQSKETFTINLDGAPSRFGSGYQMVRIGLQGKTIPDDKRQSANLVFLIDISGSMDRENRLGMVKRSLRIMIDELGEGDRVGIVVYGSQAEVRLQPTDISHREEILGAIDGLQPSGATNAYDGLQKAYRMARENYESHKLNRLILCSDGVANMGGSTKADELLEQIRKDSDSGITLSTIGFGMGNYNDVLMEKLADLGDGNYYYVDQQGESERVFRENLTGMLQTIARQVKVQVEFDESKVKRWRLLGYENRDVADRDFRNDDVDAGEVGAGHQVTALYEIKLVDDAEGHLGTVNLRYEFPAHSDDAGQVEEISRELTTDLLVSKFSKASAHYRLQVVVAEFAEILRGSYWAKESRLEDLIPLADRLAEDLEGDKQVEELARLIRKAADLQSE